MPVHFGKNRCRPGMESLMSRAAAPTVGSITLVSWAPAESNQRSKRHICLAPKTSRPRSFVRPCLRSPDPRRPVPSIPAPAGEPRRSGSARRRHSVMLLTPRALCTCRLGVGGGGGWCDRHHHHHQQQHGGAAGEGPGRLRLPDQVTPDRGQR
jgi:hypothetical protein